MVNWLGEIYYHLLPNRIFLDDIAIIRCLKCYFPVLFLGGFELVQGFQ